MLLIGPTGAGKTPLGNLMEERGIHGARCCHFDFGQQLRDIGGLDSAPEEFSRDDHDFIREVLGKGALLERKHFHIAEKVVGRFVRGKGMGEDDILVLNGLPRHREQAEDMGGMVDICGLIILECEAADVYRRISTDAGKDRGDRTDDGVAMVRKKLDIFQKRTLPLVEYYLGRGVPVFRTKVTASTRDGEVLSDLLAMGLLAR
jgi:adenylate kinase family enzyme